MAGKIEVITGPMFSGKTTELLRRLERYSLAKKAYYAIKPERDTRKQNTAITTIRGTIAMDFEPVAMLTGIPKGADIVVLDEAQFFGEEVVSFCQWCKDQGKTVLVSGLDMDHNRKPFGYMGQLMAIADSVTKLTAICACGQDAVYTKKVSGDKTRQVEVGDQCYIPCCADCYTPSEVFHRRMDYLGRVVISKPIREVINIKELDMMAISRERDRIIIKKSIKKVEAQTQPAEEAIRAVDGEFEL